MFAKIFFTLIAICFVSTSFAETTKNTPVIPLHTEARPKTAQFITFVQARAATSQKACWKMSKDAKSIGANSVYAIKSQHVTGNTPQGAFICEGEAVKE